MGYLVIILLFLAALSALFFSMFSRGYPVSQIAENHRRLLGVLRNSAEDYINELNTHYQKLQPQM